MQIDCANHGARYVQPLSHEEFVRRIDSAVRAATTRLFESGDYLAGSQTPRGFI